MGQLDGASPLIQGLQAPLPDLGGALMGGINQGIMRPLQMAQMQAQVSNEQELQQARQDFISNPTPQSVRALAALDPQNFGSINTAHTMQTQDVQNQNVRDLSSFAALAGAGQYDDAKALAQQRVDAATRAGQDASAPQMLLKVLDSDPTKAAGIAHYMLAGMVGPDKWAEANKDLADNDIAKAKLPGELASTTANTAKTVAETNQITTPRAETAVTVDPVTGKPVFYNPKGSPADAAAAAGEAPPGVPQGIADVIPALIGSESGGDPNAKNPRSSATGAGQFLGGTWVPLMKQLHPELTAGKTDAQILAMRSDPTLAHEATTQYAVQNAQTLQAANLPVNGATVAMSHKLGPGGAQAVLKADPNASLTKVLSPEVIKANPQLAKLTAGQYAQGLIKQFGASPISLEPADPGATGDDFLKTLPPARQNMIKAIADGRMAAPSLSSRSPGAQQILAQVTQYDPTFDAANSKTRVATRLNFTSGKASTEIKALNTAIGHVGELDDAIDGLNNTGFPLNNAAAHVIAAGTGTAARIKQFEVAKSAALGEVNKVFTGSAGALADREEWKKQLSADSSPSDLHKTVGEIASLLQSRIDALGEQYTQGMGKSVDGISLLTPKAQQTFLNLGKSGSEKPPAAAVIALRKSPQQFASQFDAKYGPGAANAYLGKQERLQ